MKKLSPADIDNIVESYTNLVRMTEIAAHYSLSRQRIWQVLRTAGVDTSKKKGGIAVTCDFCGKTFKKPRCQIRKCLHHFCCNKCRYDWKKSTPEEKKVLAASFKEKIQFIIESKLNYTFSKDFEEKP